MKPSDRIEELKTRAEADLAFFIKLVSPHHLLGGVHEELIQWWERPDAKDHQLVLLPRDHQKSRLIAYRVAWYLTKNPAATFLYISATSGLAEKQLYFIKNILTSKIYRQFWPDMVHPEEGKRERWTTSEIAVDHPERKREGVRDPSIFTAGLTTSITGLHFDHIVLDDVVVRENAYTQEGRTKVTEAYSLLASIASGNSTEWAVGTRYHPKDLYDTLLEMEEDVYDEAGEIIEARPVYELFQKEVEDRGDGTGEFLWPRQQRPDGKWFGFNKEILAKKRAKYLDKTQFYAQYYNNPNAPGEESIPKDLIQYYDKKFITNKNGSWYFKEQKLNIYAAIDFAYTKSKRADYTAMVVVGIDPDSTIYVLDIDRARTDKLSDYFDMILRMYVKWNFKKLRAEANAAQSIIVQELKNNYIRPNGLSITLDEHKPNRYEGTKEERVMAILEPRYSNGQMWHYMGGNCQILEEELTMAHPPHDDVMDALSAAVSIAVAPTRKRLKEDKGKISFNSRFGGIA